MVTKTTMWVAFATILVEQSTLSKAATLGTKATVRFREVSTLERVPLQRYKCNSARTFIRHSYEWVLQTTSSHVASGLSGYVLKSPAYYRRGRPGGLPLGKANGMCRRPKLLGAGQCEMPPVKVLSQNLSKIAMQVYLQYKNSTV